MSKRIICQALLARELHERSICPRNHDLEYAYGWFYIDDRPPFRDPQLTSEADELLAKGYKGIYRREGMADIPIIIHKETGEPYEMRG